MTINAVIIKNIPQSPFNQSTNAPEDAAKVVLPAVPIDANKAYWASTGFLDDSRNLIGANESVTKKMKSDIQDIRVNSYALQNKYELMKLSTAQAAKNKVFGGYASIGSSMATGYSNYELYTAGKDTKTDGKKKS